MGWAVRRGDRCRQTRGGPLSVTPRPPLLGAHRSWAASVGYRSLSSAAASNVERKLLHVDAAVTVGHYPPGTDEPRGIGRVPQAAGDVPPRWLEARRQALRGPALAHPRGWRFLLRDPGTRRLGAVGGARRPRLALHRLRAVRARPCRGHPRGRRRTERRRAVGADLPG